MKNDYSFFILFSLISFCAHAQQDVTFSQVPSERLPVWRGYGERVEAILHLPDNAKEKVPVVVMIHSAGGYDQAQDSFYGTALREVGIGTLSLILFRVGSRTHVPSDLVPHAFGALKYLADHPRVDSTKIGITGFSLGGILSMYTASSVLAREHLGDSLRYAAHVPVYPVCWIHENIVKGVERQKRLANAYETLTDAPILILAGARDELDDPDGCQKFVDALTPGARKSVSLLVYPDATHVWDAGRNYRYFDRGGCKGRGCQVNVVSNPDIAAKGRRAMVDFFSSILLQKKAASP